MFTTWAFLGNGKRETAPSVWKTKFSWAPDDGGGGGEEVGAPEDFLVGRWYVPKIGFGGPGRWSSPVGLLKQKLLWRRTDGWTDRWMDGRRTEGL